MIRHTTGYSTHHQLSPMVDLKLRVRRMQCYRRAPEYDGVRCDAVVNATLSGGGVEMYNGVGVGCDL